MGKRISGRVVLSEDSPINYRIHEERVSMNYVTGEIQSEFGVIHGTVEPSKEPVDGHWGIFLIERAYHAAGYPLKGFDMLGIAHNESEIPNEAYKCSRKYAEEVASACSCILIDNTSRGDETHNLQQEQILREYMVKQRLRDLAKELDTVYPFFVKSDIHVDIGD